MVEFGEVVWLSKVRRSDPLADGVDRYVGLERMEPGDWHIRSWGNVADRVTFNRAPFSEQPWTQVARQACPPAAIVREWRASASMRLLVRVPGGPSSN